MGLIRKEKLLNPESISDGSLDIKVRGQNQTTPDITLSGVGDWEIKIVD
jgi:hypothetical protein